MIAPLRALRPTSPDRPTYQWESGSGGTAPTLRLYGTLGRRELALVVDAITERARAPRDVVSIDFENVSHVDFRALPEFAQRMARHRHRGASVWLTGLSPYVHCLFDVAGQGALLRQLEWEPVSTARREPLRPF